MPTLTNKRSSNRLSAHSTQQGHELQQLATKVEELCSRVQLLEEGLGIGERVDTSSAAFRVHNDVVGRPQASEEMTTAEPSLQRLSGDGNIKDSSVSTWRFRETCWDAAAFVGHSSTMLLAESVVVVVLCALSFGIQGCLVLIVILNLSTSPIDQEVIDGFHLWRTLAGHDIHFTNPLTSESLASRVCRGDTSLHLSGTQARFVEEIDNYLVNKSPFNGPLMCVLAIFTWALTVSKEFHGLLDMWIALLSLPAENGSILKLVDGRLVVCSFHRTRLFWIACLSLIRFSIAASLLVAGLTFLSATYEVTEILLNTVALEFVLNVDELLYHALAPAKTRNMILQLRAVPVPNRRLWHGLDLQIPLTIISCVVLLWAAVSLSLAPEIEKMKEAKDQLCSGFRDFSYGVDAIGHTSWATNHGGVSGASQRFFESGRYEAIRGIIEQGKATNDSVVQAARMPMLFGPVWSVNAQSQLSIVGLSETRFANPSCKDRIGVQASTYFTQGYIQLALRVLRDADGRQSVTMCREVSMHCNSYGNPGSTVRLICPETCKCNAPGSSLALPKDIDGCPNTCQKSSTYKKQQDVRQCTQPRKPLLSEDRIWQEFGTAWRNATAFWPGSYNIYLESLATNFVARGCEVILDHHVGIDLCSHQALKSLAFWCPLYCNCNSTRRSECPQECVVNQAIQFGTQVPSDI